jgi:hypothetical protein
VTRCPAAIVLRPIVRRKPTQPAREAREKGRRAQACKEHIGEFRGLLEVSFHVEVVAKVGFAQREIRGRQEHPPERPRPPQHDGEAWLTSSARTFHRPRAAPQTCAPMAARQGLL